jgi:hypothetical protein
MLQPLTTECQRRLLAARRVVELVMPELCHHVGRPEAAGRRVLSGRLEKAVASAD